MGIDIDCIWTDKKRTLFGLPLSFTRYILTEKKFIVRTGFLNVHESEFDLYRVIDKSLDLPLGQRMFGCGSVNITVRDADSPLVTVRSIKQPRKFMEIFEEHVDIMRDKYNTRGRDMIAPEPPMPPEDD
ncbi:MAG: PH domain-containing protein [Oscillospiraceae bacterium]